jgi:hypothetical protein
MISQEKSLRPESDLDRWAPSQDRSAGEATEIEEDPLVHGRSAKLWSQHSAAQGKPPSAANQAAATETFREVNGDGAASAGAPAVSASASAGAPAPAATATTSAPAIGKPPSAANQAAAMEMFREVNGDNAASAGAPATTTTAATTSAPAIGKPPSAANQAAAMEMFREVNGDSAASVSAGAPAPTTTAATTSAPAIGKPPSAANQAAAMEMFREVNGDSAASVSAGAPASVSNAAVGKPPSAANQAAAMDMFREANGGASATAPATPVNPAAATEVHADAGIAPAQPIARDTLVGGDAANHQGVDPHAAVANQPAAVANQPAAVANQPAAVANQPAAGIPGPDAGPDQLAVAHAKAHDPDASTAHIERPDLGKPAEIADKTEAIDPRGAAKPDVANQLASLNQLAQPQQEKPSDDALQALARTEDAGPKVALDELHDPQAMETAVKTLEGNIGAAHDAKLSRAIQHHEAEHAKHRDVAIRQRQQVDQHGQQAIATQRRSVEAGKAHKHLSKDELRAKLTTAADAKRLQLDQNLETKKAELDTKLKAKLDKAQRALDEANTKLTVEVDAKAKHLEADIAKRKAAHDAEIAKQRPALEAQGLKEEEALRAKGKSDADKVKAEALAQADKTQANAETRAIGTETKGETEAKAAITAGDTQAKRATDAAEARAKAVTDAGEAEHVRGEGKVRADMAHGQATTRADELRVQAKAAAQALRDKGKADHDAELKHGEDRAAEAIKNGEAAADKVKAATVAAIGKMQAESDAAVTQMNAEVAQMRAELEAKRATMTTDGAKAIADATAAVETEKAKALADMQVAHDKARKTIDDSVAKDVEKIEHANEKDLARLEREVDQDIRKIDQATRQAAASIECSINMAEQKAAVQVNRAKATINADRAKALTSLQHSAAQARQRIATDDKQTKKKIDAAATQGGKDIATTSAQATADLETANQKLVEQTKLEGDTRRAEADKQAATAASAMEGSRKKLDGEISKAWVDDAVAKSHKKMERGLTDWAVTDADAVEAMNNLNSLPAAEQGQAIKQLDKDDFDKLLDNVPDERREEFKSLVDNTHDPERKLALFGEYQKSHVANDAKKDAAATQDTGWWPFESKEQDKNRHLNSIRDQIVKSNNNEIDDELKFLDEKQKAGTLTEADVLALETRKEHEHQIERKYNVNLTSKEGKRGDGTKIAWTDSELNQVDSALGRMPEAAVKDNTMLKRIERSDMSEDEDDKTKPRIGGDHSGGVIKIYDTGTGPGFRLDGAPREIADPSVAPAAGPTLGSIEVSLDHELGHDLHDQNADAFKRYQAAAGWQGDVDDDQMKTQGGLSEADIKKLKDASKAHQHMELVGKDGKVYENDPYSKGDIIAYDKDALPTTADAQPGATPINSDTWWYARSNAKDDFAEQCTKAVHTPETLAKDMLDAPAARVTKTTADAAASQASLAAERAKTPPDPAVIAALEAKAKKSQDEVAAAQKEQTARKTQFDIMRDDIFHTNTETEAAVARLQAKKVDPAKIAEFRAKAARVSTPQQVNVLESGY